MATKKKQSTNFFRQKKVFIPTAVMILTLLVAGSWFAIYKIRFYNDMANQASIVQIRELVLTAVQGLKKDAPVDPKTGDIYFPEKRVYLPNPSLPTTFTYLHDTGDITSSGGELSVSTYPVRATTGLYSARNMTELFDAVPKLQACSRGIKLIEKQLQSTDTDNSLRQTVRLTDGRTIYVYVEKKCSELNELADLFKNLKSY